MAVDSVQERQQAHAYLDRLRPEQLSAVRGLLETMLSPLDRKLALAPVDDEPVNPEETRRLKPASHLWNVTVECLLKRFWWTSALPWTTFTEWLKGRYPKNPATDGEAGHLLRRGPRRHPSHLIARLRCDCSRRWPDSWKPMPVTSNS